MIYILNQESFLVPLVTKVVKVYFFNKVVWRIQMDEKSTSPHYLCVSGRGHCNMVTVVAVESSSRLCMPQYIDRQKMLFYGALKRQKPRSGRNWIDARENGRGYFLHNRQ